MREGRAKLPPSRILVFGEFAISMQQESAPTIRSQPHCDPLPLNQRLHPHFHLHHQDACGRGEGDARAEPRSGFPKACHLNAAGAVNQQPRAGTRNPTLSENERGGRGSRRAGFSVLGEFAESRCGRHQQRAASHKTKAPAEQAAEALV